MYQCQLCQYETNNNNQYQKHLKTKIHLFNINNFFTVDSKNQDNVLIESKIMTHKQFLDWCIFLDSKIFEENYQQFIVSLNQKVKFKIIHDQILVRSPPKTEDTGISCNLEYSINNKTIDKNISIYSKNIISTINLLFSYLNYNLNWLCPYSEFIQGFMGVGCIYLIYLVLSSLIWILFWSTLGGFGWRYMVKKLK